MNEQTFVFADLAGFTALTEAHGDEAAAELAFAFASSVGTWLDEFGGGEQRLLGDELMLRLPDAAAAIESGLAIVERAADTDGFPDIRVGMNTGTAVQRQGQWFGATVNLAARVVAAAEGGEVLLTERTADAAGQPEGIHLLPLGLRRFRNIVDPVSVLRAERDHKLESVVVDPVCRMSLRPDQPAETLVYADQEFRFCSRRCRDAFAARPATFLSETR